LASTNTSILTDTYGGDEGVDDPTREINKAPSISRFYLSNLMQVLRSTLLYYYVCIYSWLSIFLAIMLRGALQDDKDNEDGPKTFIQELNKDITTDFSLLCTHLRERFPKKLAP
jgi:SNF family Na+-dependent transporter